jgi:phage replication O-like protein O
MNIGVDFDKYIKQAKPVEDNYTKTPNMLIDSIMRHVSPNAYKCLNLIVRCTVGYQRESCPISHTVFLENTGIKRKETVIDAIKELEQLKIIFVDRSTHINTFSLTLDQYEKTVLVLKNRTDSNSTEKPYQQGTEKPQLNSTENPYPIKERKKKENNNIKKQEKFSFAQELKNLGADDQLIKDWLIVRKTKKASNTETAFGNFKNQLDKTSIDLNTILKICIDRDWKGFNASWLQNVDLLAYQDQNPQAQDQTIAEQPQAQFKGVVKKFKGMGA